MQCRCDGEREKCDGEYTRGLDTRGVSTHAQESVLLHQLNTFTELSLYIESLHQNPPSLPIATFLFVTHLDSESLRRQPRLSLHFGGIGVF
jgi:hypothetical protein